MDHRVPKVGMVVSILLAIGAAITFVFLNKQFEGPDPVSFLSSPYELRARFEDSNTLPSKQAVLHKGVSVGRVSSVEWDAETRESIVHFELTDEVAPIYEDASIQIGERSLLGDAYLNLVDLGTEASGELATGDEVKGTLPSVRFDEALDFLDEEGRARVRSLIDTVAEGASRPGNGYKLNSTVGGLSQSVHELRVLTDSLRGQEKQIADLTSSAATVLTELGNRESALRTIVGSGRTTLDALAVNTASLDQAMVELPLLLDSGRNALADLRPLLIEARPLLADVRALIPDLIPAFEDGAPFSIGALSTDLVDIIEGLEPQRRVSENLLPKVLELTELTLPLVQKATPAARNGTTIADYLAPRSNSIGAFFALGTSVAGHSDSVGNYARFGVVADPGTGLDQPPNCPSAGICRNAYPGPNDALDNQPFIGAYPRLMPFDVPSRRSVLNGVGP